MRLYTTQHPFSCGIDLQAHAMDVCILHQAGETLLHRHMKTNPETFLHAIAPSRAGLVVAVACMFTWYWLAELCAAEGIPFVRGQALSLKAMHGGKAKHDQIDSRKSAVLLRGGMLPHAYVYPAELRATRDLRRRRRHLAHTRGALLAHVQHTNSQDNLPAIGKKIAYQANRDGVAQRFADPAVHKSIAGDLALLGDDDELLRDVDLPILTTATHHDAHPLDRLQTVPGIGQILSRVLLDDLHQSDRCPRVQALASSCRLTGQSWGEPDTCHALSCITDCVSERRGASRSRSLSQRFDEPPPPAPAHRARGVTGSRGLLLPEPAPHWTTGCRCSGRVPRPV